MRESMSSCHIVLCMSSISFNLSPHPIFLSINSLSHKYRKLRDLVPLVRSEEHTSELQSLV